MAPRRLRPDRAGEQHADAEDQRHVDGDVGAQVPLAVAACAGAGWRRSAGDQAAQRHDRQRHVEVEDLLDEALVGVDAARRRRPARAPRSARRRWRWRGRAGPCRTRGLSPPGGSRRRAGEEARRPIVEGEHRSQLPEVARRRRSASSGAVAFAAAISDRHEQRQQRAAARSARARASRPRARRRARRRREPEVGEQRARRAARAARRAPGPSSSSANAGSATSSTATRNRKSAARLGQESAVRSIGREQQAVEPALLALGGEQAGDAEHGGEQQRHPQDARRERAVERVAVEPEVEQHERGDARTAPSPGPTRGCAARARRSLRRIAIAARIMRTARDVGRASTSPPARRTCASAAQRRAPGRPRPAPPSTSWRDETRVRPDARPISGSSSSAAAGSRFARGSSSSSSSRVVQHGARDGEPLHHAARELADAARRRGASRPTAASSSSTRSLADAVEPRLVAQVLARR